MLLNYSIVYSIGKSNIYSNYLNTTPISVCIFNYVKQNN